MSWSERIITAAYNSPLGNRMEFDYEDVSMSVDKRTSAFEFPDANGTLIQELGHSGRKYPFRLFIWGEDYDLEAERFLKMLLEPGIGTLEHPIYGVINVVPFGTIKRSDQLKTAANQAIFEISFWESITRVYPTNTPDPATDVLLSIEEFNIAAGIEFEEFLDIETFTAEATFIDGVLGFINSVASVLSSVVATTQSVLNQFNSIKSSITNGINTLVNAPLTLAAQITQLIQAPGRALASIKDRLNGFKDLLGNILTGGGDGTEIKISQTENELRTNDLFAQSYVTGSIVSVVNNQFTTKTEAIEAAEEILTQFDDLIEWRDANYQALGVIDTGDSYQKLQEAVSIVTGFLVQISFDLKQERSIVLDRDRTLIDVVGELYGVIDEKLDFFIVTNDLTGSEILELPKGREILYYE